MQMSAIISILGNFECQNVFYFMYSTWDSNFLGRWVIVYTFKPVVSFLYLMWIFFKMQKFGIMELIVYDQ